MTPKQRLRVEELFHIAAELPAAQRPEYLDVACGNDREVREEVESLLDAEVMSMASQFQTGAAALVEPCGGGENLVGSRVGRYEIKGLIDEGGMGIVYLAEQEQPKRLVALKVMRPGTVSNSGLRRFQEESRFLGNLQHEGIAKVFEAGVHGEGAAAMPYFAMEHVAGARSITEYAREAALSVRQKLELFAKVCDAVEHAHQKLVIHRDLKPSNILVGTDRRAKVIDFGVARSTDSEWAAITRRTDAGHLIGTLQYMSPEQCSRRDVDTRSDVYALGLILYELLAESRPYELSGSSIAQAARVIEERPPARLSAIDKRLRGDVETITLKAMEKDRDRRYQSAAGLAEDLRRYLEKQPIKARPPSVGYLVHMFARRHKGAFWGGIAAVSGLVTGIVVAIVSRGHAIAARHDAVIARNEAQHVTEFIVGFLDSQDPSAPGWNPDSGISAMSAAARNIDGGELRDQPAPVLRAVSAILGSNGKCAEARTVAERALFVDQKAHPGDHADVASSLRNLAGIVDGSDKLGAGEPWFRQALEMNRRLCRDGDDEVVKSLGALASLLRKMGDRDDEALELSAEALRIVERVHADDQVRVAASRSGYAYMLEGTQQYAEAKRLYAQVVATYKNMYPGNNGTVAGSLNALAWVCAELGDGEGAVQAGREALEMRRHIAKDPSPAAAGSLSQLGGIYGFLDQWDEAERQYEEALSMARSLYTGDHPTVAAGLNNLALARENLGRARDAEPLYLQALRMWRNLYEGDHAGTANTLADIARCHSTLGKISDAQKEATEAADMAGRLFASKENKARRKCDDVLEQIMRRVGTQATPTPPK